MANSEYVHMRASFSFSYQRLKEALGNVDSVDLFREVIEENDWWCDDEELLKTLEHHREKGIPVGLTKKEIEHSWLEPLSDDTYKQLNKCESPIERIMFLALLPNLMAELFLFFIRHLGYSASEFNEFFSDCL